MTHATLSWMYTASWHAVVLAVVIGIATFAVRRRIPPVAAMLLWSLVLLRLVLPALPASRWSVYAAVAGEVTPDALPTQVLRIDLPGDRVQAELSPHPAAPSVRGYATPLAIAWIGIGVGLFATSCISTIKHRRRVEVGAGPADARFELAMDDAVARLPVRRRPTLVLSDLVGTPCLVGLLRPVIVLPASAARWDAGRLSHVLFHELLHARHRDLWVDVVLRAVACLHWFNPAGWVAVAQFRLAREARRDGQVLAIIGRDESAAYGRTLLDLSTAARPAHLGVAMVGSANGLRHRIALLVSTPTTFGLVAGMVLAGFVGCTFLTRPSPSVAETSAVAEQTYDVLDFRIVIADFAPDAPQVDEARLRRQQMQALTEAVAKLASGPGESAKLVDDEKLVVVAAAKTQRSVAAMLAAAREARETQITVTARFYEVSRTWAEGRTLDAAVLDEQSKREVESGTPAPAKPSGVVLWGRPSPLPVIAVSAPRITLFNGQRAYVTVSSEQAYVQNINRVQGDGGAVGYDPTIGMVKSGITLDARARVTADRGYVTIDLKPKVSRLIRLESRPLSELELTVMIQVPTVRRDAIDTTLGVPDGYSEVVKLEPSQFELDPDSGEVPVKLEADDRDVYLVVRADVRTREAANRP